MLCHPENPECSEGDEGSAVQALLICHELYTQHTSNKFLDEYPHSRIRGRCWGPKNPQA
jgi:hypothetical protein